MRIPVPFPPALLLLAMSFVVPAVLVAGGGGDTVQRLETRTLRFAPTPVGHPVGIDTVLSLSGDDSGEQYRVAHVAAPPFGDIVVDGRPLPPVGQSVKVSDRLPLRVRFLPRRPGAYEDSVLLVRERQGKDADTVRLRLVGVARDVFADLAFGTVLVGERVEKEALFRRDPPDGPRITWRVVDRVEPPFSVLTQTVPPNGANPLFAVAVAFEPTRDGRAVDRAAYERTIDVGMGPEILDTVVITIAGTGQRQPASREVDLGTIRTGRDTAVNATLELPLPPRREWQYTFDTTRRGGITAAIVNETALGASVTVRFSASYATAGTYTERFVLRRKRRGGTDVVDSTTYEVSVQVRQPDDVRPDYTLHAATTDSLAAFLGDTVRIPVLMVQTRGSLPLPISAVRCTLQYNPSVLVPVADAGQRITLLAMDDEAAMVVEQDVAVTAGDMAVLCEIPLVVVLGDDSRSALRFVRAEVVRRGMTKDGPTDNDVTDVLGSSRLTSTVIHVADAWSYQGGTRRVNSLQGTADIVVEPNPVDVDATLRVTNVPANVGSLVIVDASGRIARDLTAELRRGVTSFPITRDGPDGLSTGVWYAMLQIRGVDQRPLERIVRLIVVR